MLRQPLFIVLRALRSTAMLCLILLLSFASAYAQTSAATLSGTVVDQNNAIVPSVEIVITNPATALERTTTTSDAGYFTVPLLPPGTYVITAKRQGFAPIRISNLVLNVGDNKSVQIELRAGDVNAQVTIDSDAETVRTDGSVGTVVNRQFVANIPLNGRSLQALIQLTPGVVLTSNRGDSATGAAQFSINGQRTTSNYFMVDGVSANTGITVGVGFAPGASGSGQTAGTTALGGTNSLVSLDALQEFRVETSTFAAEFGRTPGGQISLLTRGGANEFHGSASYYFRNDALDANDWFANANRQPKPKERQSLFGGVFGGPIKRDRLFFFGSYEGLRLQQPKVAVVTVPSTALRTQAPAALRPYLNALPLPNGRDFGDGTAQLAASYSEPAKFDVFAIRIDGRVAKDLMGFFRFSHAPSETKSRFFSLSTLRAVQARNDSYTGGITWVPQPHLTFDWRVNWTRNAGRAFDDLDTFNGAVIPNSSDVFLPGRDPSKAQFSFNAPGSSGFFWGSGIADIQRQFNAVGTAGWSINAHQFKFGVDYRRLLPLLGGAAGGFQEQLFFRTAADVASGQAFFYYISTLDPIAREAVISNLSLFAQDAWHVTRRLTFTYGLRLERVPPPTEVSGRTPRTVLGVETDLLQNPRLAPEGTPLFRGRFGSLAPRFGLAYQMNQRHGWESTLRGGVGVFYDLPLANIANAFSNYYPYFADKQACCFIPFPLSNADRTPPLLGAALPTRLFLLDPNLRLPYTIEWNATWEQAIGRAQTLTASYVGASGRRLLVNQNYRQSLVDFPGTATLLQINRNLAKSSYNALQVQYQRRLDRGLQALVSYTLAHSQDNASAVDANTPPANQANLLAQQYGPSDFDVRHVFSGAVTYDLPRLSGPALLNALLSDWGLDLLARYQSSFPVSPTAGSISINGFPFTRRPDVVPGQPLYIDDARVPGGRRFNPAAFAQPAAGQQGSFPRNGLRGFPASQVDLALRREFRMGEKVRLQLRGELFNLFNHPNFGGPETSFTNARFGQPSQMLNRSLGGLNALYQVGGPRSGQLALKILF